MRRACCCCYPCCCVAMCVLVRVLASRNETAKFWLWRARGASADVFFPLELAPPSEMSCNYCNPDSSSQPRINTAVPCSEPFLGLSYEPDKFVSSDFRYILYTVWRLSLPSRLFPSSFPAEMAIFVVYHACYVPTPISSSLIWPDWQYFVNSTSHEAPHYAVVSILMSHFLSQVQIFFCLFKTIFEWSTKRVTPTFVCWKCI